jgi:hypothetical protein
MAELLFINKVKENREAFAAKVIEVAGKLGINPDWLMAVMNSESGLDPKAVNKQGASMPGKDKDGKVIKPAGTPDSTDARTRSQYRATGLIQFMPATAKGLKTTTQAIYDMSNVQQMEFVYQYFLPYKSRIKTYFDLYLVTFYPAALKYSTDDNAVIGQERSEKVRAQIAAGNNFDSDGNKLISIAEFKAFINKKLPKDALERFGKFVKEVSQEVIKETGKAVDAAKANPGKTAAGIGALFFFGWGVKRVFFNKPK